MTNGAVQGGEQAVDINDARPRRWGWLLLLLGVAGFLGWALWVPLDAGVSASGVVVVTGNRKVVQPLVAGKVVAVMVRDGDMAKFGQVLVRLDETQSRSQLEIARGQWLSRLAEQARLLAERSGKGVLEFPASLLQSRVDPRSMGAMTVQTQLFTTRRQGLRSELQGMEENIRGLEFQLRGLDEAREAREGQKRLLREELKNMRELAADGFLARNRVSEQERVMAALDSSIAEDGASRGRVSQAIAEMKVRMLSRQHEFRQQAETALVDVEKDIASLQARMEALAFELANAQISSPTDGVVMNVATHTVGGVVSAGSTLMEVVPQNEPLLVDAQVPPHLIDKIKAGQEVDVLFPAFSQATTPHVPGRVLRISADVMVDARLNQPYFKATVEVVPEGLARLRRHEIRAGMPAEVFIRTGERTPMNYLLKPLLDRMNSAMTEP